MNNMTIFHTLAPSIETDHFIELEQSIIPAIQPLLVFIGVLILILLVFKIPFLKKAITSHLKVGASIIWVSGFILYAIGFNEPGSASLITLCFRAALSSLEMFVSHSDLIEVAPHWHSNPLYMIWFSTTHFLAVIISAIFIVRILGLRTTSKISLVTYRIWPFFQRDLFVFWGINNNAIITAKSILEAYENKGSNNKANKTKKNRACVLFVNLPSEPHNHYSRFSFSHFFHSSNEHVEKYVTDIEEMGALLVNANKPFNKESLGDVCNIFTTMGIGLRRFNYADKLVEKILASNSNKVEYFFLSDNERENISAIVALKTNKETYYNSKTFKCYCHARKSSFNNVLLDSNGLRHNIYLVDSSSLSILPLKETIDYHPISFVDKNTDEGYITSDFTAMVIGFGEAGRDAFRFLYEFASFPTKNGLESAKTIHVVDKQLEYLKGDFLNGAPALKTKLSQIQWWDNISTHHECFWSKLKSVINSMNYIVITVGNDDEALELALNINEFAYRYRESTDKFKIFVRLRNDEKHNFFNGIQHHDIIPFGNNKQIFSYKTISVEAIEDGAMEFYFAYNNLKGQHTNKNALWIERRNTYMNKNDLITLHYQEEQDISNYRHIMTKRRLAGLSEFESGEIIKSRLVKGCSLFTNLSRCEHLRWNAKMELLGFIYDDKEKKNIQRRTHRCLIACNELENGQDKSDIQFDWEVVTLSFDPRFDKNSSK